jgi:hypothetical protein
LIQKSRKTLFQPDRISGSGVIAGESFSSLNLTVFSIFLFLVFLKNVFLKIVPLDPETPKNFISARSDKWVGSYGG